jgi:hypothetical protein
MNAINSLYKAVAKSRSLKSLLLLPFYIVRFAWYSIANRSLWFLRYYPGHYGSPLPSGREIKEQSARFFGSTGSADGISSGIEKQLELLDEFSAYHDDFAPNENAAPGKLYYYRNDMYGFADGLILYCFLRHFNPGKIVEVGSGHSSALMLDCGKSFLPDTHFTFIDPYSTTIGDVLKANAGSGNYRLVREPVQDVDLSVYSELGENDILFIDSSHVVRIGSDLSTILYSILPSLKRGVIVHFHDIYYPFEYHQAMLDEGRAWNEIYFVRAFLQFNSAFEILFFNSLLERKYIDEVRAKLPNYFRSGGNSLWLRKTA